MPIDENDPAEQDEVGETRKRFEKRLAEKDKELQQVDEAIKEAKKKSKCIIPDPES
jgi:hypothetical protein